MLIVFGGLPGTGKTTLSRILAERRSATYLRIDAIEQAIRDARVLAGDVETSGYAVAQALAEINLTGGRIVVVDAVNALSVSRDAWRAIGARAAARVIGVEITCSDAREHQRRVERRVSDIAGLVPPTWRHVTSLKFEPWDNADVRVDTACLSVEDSIASIERCLDGRWDDLRLR